MRFVVWLLTYAVGIAVAALLLDGIWFEGAVTGDAEMKDKLLPVLGVALILGLVSTFVEPVIRIVTLPLVVLTFGLLLVVINALMLLLTARLAEEFGLGFHIDAFTDALLGAVVVTVMGWAIRVATPSAG